MRKATSLIAEKATSLFAKKPTLLVAAYSIIREQEKIAIGNIKFGITKTEYNRQKTIFLNKCGKPGYYKIGEYVFDDMKGLFHNGKLYWVYLIGDPIKYDDYDLLMPSQYESLISIMRKKYKAPERIQGLPKWNHLNKSDIIHCAEWEIGGKDIDILIRCNGVDYSLSVIIDRTDISRKISEEKEARKNESNDKGADLL